MGNDPTGRKEKRVGEEGDPARSSGGVLERERDRDDVGVRSEWVWGRWNSPCLLITPTRFDTCGSTAVIAVVPLGR